MFSVRSPPPKFFLFFFGFKTLDQIILFSRWVLGFGLLMVYTLVKFYLLKPNFIPKPEKESFRVGTPMGTPQHTPRTLSHHKED